jgi:S-adenosylmethionine:tRNA ribosyltransferase-isomerase
LRCLWRPNLASQESVAAKLHLVRTEEFDFHLPPELIAQRPLPRRDGSRLLLLQRGSAEFRDEYFASFPTLLLRGDLLVLNNTKVIPARLFGYRLGVHSEAPARITRKEHLTGKVEIFLVRRIAADLWEAMVRPGRKIQTGERIRFGDGALEAEVIERLSDGLRALRFKAPAGGSLDQLLLDLGHVPLPPYIDRPDEPADRERYQTVFAKEPGAIAAPTAGLHFTPQILAEIRKRGAEICELTLHVGIGTFKPVQTETIEEHQMHGEAYEIAPEVARQITDAKRAGRRIIAVGTTVVRALEDAALSAAQKSAKEMLLAGKAEARILITPGFPFRLVDALVTNFHLPKSTLLALVSAFAGREHVLSAYHHAVRAGYRFYSYGDCMFIA